MGRNVREKRKSIEFRFYEIPQGTSALVLCGDSWIRRYGIEEKGQHFHNLWEIGICRYGSGELYLDDKVKTYSDDDITIIPENFPHLTKSENGSENFWEYIFIDLNSLIEEMFPGNITFQNDAINKLSKGAVLLKGKDNPVLRECINSIIRETKSRKMYYQRAISLMVQNIVIELLRSNNTIEEELYSENKNPYISQISAAIEYVNENYHDVIKISQLADICSVSQTHFRRLFEYYMNMPPLEYVNFVRIQKACEFLRKNNESMEVIAQKCGFITPSTFNRNFKKYVGVTPYQWKKNPENYQHKLLNFNISSLKGWK